MMLGNRTDIGNSNSNSGKTYIVNFKEVIGYSLLLIILFYFFWSFPLSGDDFYNLKTPLSFEANWEKWIHYNGRVLGNLMYCYTRRNAFGRGSLRAISFLMMVLFSKKLIHADQNRTFFVIMLLLFPASQIFSQVYTWMTGWYYYIMPIVIMLCAVYIIVACQSYNVCLMILFSVLLGIMGIAQQLFVEHNTLMNMVLSIILLVFYAKDKEKRILATIYCAASVLGMLIMFGIMIFLCHNDYYGVTSLQGIFKTVLQNYRLIAEGMIGNSILWCVLSYMCCVMLDQNQQIVQKYKKIIRFPLLVLPAYSIGEQLLLDEWSMPNFYIKPIIAMLLFLTYGMSVTLILWKTVKLRDTRRKIRIYLPFALGIGALLPLLFVSPIPARTYFLSYYFWAIGSIELSKELNVLQSEYMKAGVKIGLCTALLMLIICVKDMNYADEIRSDYICRQLEENEEEIVIPYLPHSRLIYSDGIFIGKAYFKNEKDDTRFVFISWEEWIKVHNEYL